LKKRSKKLSVLGGVGEYVPKPAVNESFLLLFFKKEALASFLQGKGLRDFSRSPFCSAQRFETS
jgi:hypothetical protein